jgi:multiple sugar transport system substrate-binding protein
MVTRRRFLTALGVVALAVPLLQACGANGAAATAASQAAAVQASVAAAASAAPAASTASTSAATASTAPVAAAGNAPVGAKTPLSITVWTIVGRDWQKQYAQKYQQQHPEVALRIDEIVYADMPQKQLTEAASNTLQDVVYSGIKWFPYSAYKGVFRPLDDLVAQKDPGKADFFSDAVAGSTYNGKLYGLPFEVNPGNLNAIVYNQDLLDKKGVKAPTDNWTITDFAQMATQLTDSANKVFGTDMLFGSYYDLDTLARSLGGEILSSDGKNFTLTTDPNTVKAAQWATDLIVTMKAVPPQAQAASIAFPAGQVALHADGVQGVIADKAAIGTKFKWGAVLGPTGPGGLRGRDGFVTMYNMAARSKYPQQAYDLMMFMTSKDTALWAMPNQGQPSARQSVWNSPEVKAVNDIFPRAAAWMADPKDKGPFPMPANLRFSELQDKFANLSTALFYGKVSFAAGMKAMQDACQQIVAEPIG